MKFSIVTISYNQAPYLEECIKSVVSQKAVGDQYIVVDPGSTDGSRDIIRRYHLNGIDTVIMEGDKGPADGLNKGFDRARGELLCYVNADDRLLPNALAYARRGFEVHPNIDVLCGTIRIIDENGRVAWRRRTADPFDLRRYAAGICTVGQQATFFRREAFERAGRFNVANRICWDGELLVDMALAGARFMTVRRALGDFRIYGESITGSGKFLDKLMDEHARIGDKIAKHGVNLFSAKRLRIERWVYKFNPLRQLNYLLAHDDG